MLAVPRLLDDMIAAGRWPHDSKEAMAFGLGKTGRVMCTLSSHRVGSTNFYLPWGN